MSVPIACIGRGVLVLLAAALIAAPASGQAGPLGVTWDEKIEVASGGGYRGPWRMNESEFQLMPRLKWPEVTRKKATRSRCLGSMLA